MSENDSTTIHMSYADIAILLDLDVSAQKENLHKIMLEMEKLK